MFKPEDQRLIKSQGQDRCLETRDFGEGLKAGGPLELPGQLVYPRRAIGCVHAFSLLWTVGVTSCGTLLLP